MATPQRKPALFNFDPRDTDEQVQHAVDILRTYPDVLEVHQAYPRQYVLIVTPLYDTLFTECCLYHDLGIA